MSRTPLATLVLSTAILGAVVGAIVGSSVEASAQTTATPSTTEATAVAAAHSAYETADFAGTLAAIERAEAGTLARTELLDLLELRALAELATDATAPLDRTLTRLLSLEPQWNPTGSVAPRFLAAVQEVRARGVARLEVLTSEVTTSDGTRIEVRATDPGQLVRSHRIVWRVDHGPHAATSAALHTIEGAEGVIPTATPVRFWAEAIGPGGAVLAQSEETRVLADDEPEGGPGNTEAATVATATGGGDDTLAIVLGVIGGVVLIGGAVTLGVVLSSGSGNEQTVVMPVVRWSP